ncbi:MAG: class I SAM-dependent methyltransferase [Rhizobiaceae bacterium]
MRRQLKRFVRKQLGYLPVPNFSKFHNPEAKASPNAGPIEQAFFSHEGKTVDKWHHYLPAYDRHFAPYRDKPVGMLEIGVFKGGSLELWNSYFHPDSMIMGIDINPDCAAFDNNPCQVRIGSQADPAFLDLCIQEFPDGIDIILDDGSHKSHHVIASFSHLFPKLKDGGIYVVEDLHCAYWEPFGGNYRGRGTFIGEVRKLIDDMHFAYHGVGNGKPDITSICVYDSMIVIEKGKAFAPQMSKRGAIPQDNGQASRN